MVLKLRFGLDNGKGRTLEEVGKVFNVTRERIRQIEAKALKKLGVPKLKEKLQEYMNQQIAKIIKKRKKKWQIIMKVLTIGYLIRT